jgi:hypothetical protein
MGLLHGIIRIINIYPAVTYLRSQLQFAVTCRLLVPQSSLCINFSLCEYLATSKSCWNKTETNNHVHVEKTTFYYPLTTHQGQRLLLCGHQLLLHCRHTCHNLKNDKTMEALGGRAYIAPTHSRTLH